MASIRSSVAVSAPARAARRPGRRSPGGDDAEPGGRLGQQVTAVAAVVQRELGGTATERSDVVEVDPAAGGDLGCRAGRAAGSAVGVLHRLGVDPGGGWASSDAGADAVRPTLAR